MKYAIYARVSPRGSDFDGETSISMQLEICRRYVADRGGTVVLEKSDEFFSGKDLNRPGFAEIMKGLENGSAEWDTLLVYKLSRMTRSLRDGADIFDKLFRQGRGFVSATENLDFSSPVGRAMLGMMQVFNQFEREQTAENTRNKMMQIASRGEWPVGKPPFGYKRGEKGDNKLYVDERKALIVRDIFEMYASRQDRSRLILEKYKGIISSSTLFFLLRNRVYLGELWYNGSCYPGKHKPIIPQDLFDRVQTMLPEKKMATRPKAQTYDYLLAGLLFCSCGKRMRSLSAKSGKYHYYSCSCGKRINAETADHALIEYLEHLQIPDSFLQELRPRLESEQRKESEERMPQLKRLEQELAQCKKEMEKVSDVVLQMNPTPTLIKALGEKSEKLEADKIRLTEAISRIKSEMCLGTDYYTLALDMLNQLKKLKDYSQAAPTTLRQAILANINHAELTENAEIQIIPSSTNDSKWLPIQNIAELLSPYILFKIIRTIL